MRDARGVVRSQISTIAPAIICDVSAAIGPKHYDVSGAKPYDVNSAANTSVFLEVTPGKPTRRVFYFLKVLTTIAFYGGG